MSNNKTFSINPDLFKIPSLDTNSRKKRPKRYAKNKGSLKRKTQT